MKVFVNFLFVFVSFFSLVEKAGARIDEPIPRCPTSVGCCEYCDATNPKASDPTDRGFNACQKLAEEEKSRGIQCGNITEPTSSIPIPLPRPVSPSCQARYDAVKASCSATGDETGNKCNWDRSEAISSFTNANRAKGTASVQESCQASQQLATEASTAVTNFATGCREAMRTCVVECQKVVMFVSENPECFGGEKQEQLKDATNFKVSKCDIYSEQLGKSEQALATLKQQNTSSSQCSTATDGGAQPSEQAAAEETGTNGNGEKKEEGGGMGDLASMLGGMAAAASPQETSTAETPTFCQQNPTAIGCSSASAAVNCLDPAQATSNKVCVCSMNPFNPMCGGEQSSTSQSSFAQSYDASSRLPTAEGGDAYDPTTGLPDVVPGAPNSGGGGESLDGRQGSGNPIGQSSVGAGGKGFKSASAQSYGDNGDARAAGGGGGGGGGRGFGSSSGGSGGGANAVGAYRGPRAGSVDASKVSTADLKKFLPGGALDPRANGSAMTGSSGTDRKDGVTGPHSNNFKKMQNRYILLQNTFIP